MSNENENNDLNLAPTPGGRATAFSKRADVRRTAIIFILWTALFTVLGVWLYPKFMPKIMSKEMLSAENIMIWFTVISAPIAGIVLAIATNSFLNGHRGDTPPEEGPAVRTNGPVVAIWTVVSTVFALVAIVWGIVELNVQSADAVTNSKNEMVVEVTGSQWLWSFNYPEQGIQSHVLNLPINRPVLFKIKSVDVNHSFWPVQLGVKVDANAMVTTTVETTPNKLGEIDVKCAELCGLFHAYMETTGEVMTQSDFDAWVSKTVQNGASA